MIVSQVVHFSVECRHVSWCCDYPGGESSFYAINFLYVIFVVRQIFNIYFCCLESNNIVANSSRSPTGAGGVYADVEVPLGERGYFVFLNADASMG